MHDDDGVSEQGRAVTESADCGDAVHRLYEYLDGELTEERRTVIKHHLDSCLQCLEAFDFEAELRQVIAMRCRDEVPDHLRARVADAIRSEAAEQGMSGL